MDNNDISTEPSFLEVELPQTLLESPSTSTFLPEEEASICPLLSRNRPLEPVIISHPLSPIIVTNDITSSNQSNTDCKAETSSSGSSTGIAMDAIDTASTSLFNQVNYHHLQGNNITAQDAISLRRNSADTPCFVSWNWPLIRKCTLFVFLSGVFAMCSIIVTTIVNMPKHCNPKTSWYRGSVFYELDPTTFKDSDSNGFGDIGGVIDSLEYFKSLGVSGVRLNSVFPNYTNHERYINDSSLNVIRPELGSPNDITILAKALESHNISLLMDLPLEHLISKESEFEIVELISKSLIHWIDHGVNGFYLKGLGSLAKTSGFIKGLASWKRILGQNRVLIVEENLLRDISNAELPLIFEHIDFVDVALNIENDTHTLRQSMGEVLKQMPVGEDTPMVHWSINYNRSDVISDLQKQLYAVTIMQLMMPGTASIMHSHMISMAQSKSTNVHIDELKEQLAEQSDNVTDNSTKYLRAVRQMIILRKNSPSIYKNFVCKSNSNKPNTQVLPHRNAEIIIVVRNFPRRNSLVSITNLASSHLVLDLSKKFYSGIRLLDSNERIYFKQLSIDAFDTFVIKLDK